MSLDISLLGELTGERCWCPNCDSEHESQKRAEFFSANITHNLAAMAKEAHIYGVLWRGPEVGINQASLLIAPLQRAIRQMLNEPDRFKALDPEKGWGSYDIFVPWLQRLLAACKAHPNATIQVSR